jgi:hypothetical protein
LMLLMLKVAIFNGFLSVPVLLCVPKRTTEFVVRGPHYSTGGKKRAESRGKYGTDGTFSGFVELE